MSVIVKRLKSTSMEVYVKGAPEVMNEICVRDSCESFPCVSGLVMNCVGVDSSARLQRLALILHQTGIPCHCCCREEHRRAFLVESATDEAVSVF
jgi:hypothetical protein